MEWKNHPMDYEFFDAAEFVDANYAQIKKIWDIVTWEMANHETELEICEEHLAVIIANMIYLETEQEDMKIPFPCLDHEELENDENFLDLVDKLIFACTLWNLEEKGLVQSKDGEQTWELTELGKQVGDALNEDEASE